MRRSFLAPAMLPLLLLLLVPILACEREVSRVTPASSELSAGLGAEPEAEPAPGLAEAATSEPRHGMLSGFNAHAFAELASCQGSRVAVRDDVARCESLCECLEAHYGGQARANCVLSCSTR